ncbi:unnamed protein product [Lactuca saligna]|uniref:Uncharacterized protein n=1 Tax=Lactuca saligna TaxID=75948 RepID=A0AA35ULF0_LACSI|nr:unnamed protein product [Lactuca saligna]
MPNASLYSPPEGKVGILFTLFEAVPRLPNTDFCNLIIREYGFSMRELTPTIINKIMGFELLCCALGRLSTIPSCKDFFIAFIHYPRAIVYVDRAPTLFGADKELADVLEMTIINGEDFLDCFLAAGGMSDAWRARGWMPKFFLLRNREVVPLERVLQGQFSDELQCRDVDFVEALPPHVFG